MGTDADSQCDDGLCHLRLVRPHFLLSGDRAMVLLSHQSATIAVVEIARIRTDGQTQGRVSVDESVVSEYIELMNDGVEFPPVRAWFDGSAYWLVDGFHRLAAVRAIGQSRIAAEVLRGPLEEAQWDSYAANSSHGLRRTNADLETIVKRVLVHPKSRQLSNNQIAKHLNMPESTLRRWKKRLSLSLPLSADHSNASTIAIRGGNHYVIRTANIGKSPVKPTSTARAKSYRRLETEFERIKDLSTPDARRLLNVVEKWICGNSDGPTFLAAVEGLVRNLRNHQHQSPNLFELDR